MLKPDSSNLLSSTFINSDTYVAGFGTRNFVNTRYYEEGFKQFKEKNISFKSYAIPDQVHSSNISIITQVNEEFIHPQKTDGVITNLKDCVLAVRTADCLPIIFADYKNDYIGISHQGWKGISEELPLKMIKAFEKLGSKKEDLSIILGPAIGGCCYEIYGDRYRLFKQKFTQFSDNFFEYRNNKVYLNLIKLTYLLLLSYNMKRQQIDWFPYCTSCDKGRFYSYQRDGKDEYGEMLSFIMRRS